MICSVTQLHKGWSSFLTLLFTWIVSLPRACVLMLLWLHPNDIIIPAIVSFTFHRISSWVVLSTHCRMDTSSELEEGANGQAKNSKECFWQGLATSCDILRRCPGTSWQVWARCRTCEKPTEDLTFVWSATACDTPKSHSAQPSNELPCAAAFLLWRSCSHHPGSRRHDYLLYVSQNSLFECVWMNRNEVNPSSCG